MLSSVTLAAVLLAACTMPPRQLTVAFGPAEAAKPVVRKPRRETYHKPMPPPPVEVMPEAPRTDWLAKLNELPKDAAGGTDWVRALNEKLIQPKPGLDEKAEDQQVLDLDIELMPKDQPAFKVKYSHKVHTQLLACTNCHTAIFKMEKGGDPITMEKIFAGEYCGRCHGKVAFEVPTGCVRCHPEMPH